MRRTVVKFSENLIVACAALSIVGALLLGHYSGREALGYAVAACAALWGFRSLGAQITVTRTSLARKNLFAECRIPWEQMERIEVTGNDFWFVFHGNGTRISMPGPMSSLATLFREDDEDHEDGLATLLFDLAGEHGVPVAGSWIAPFKTSRA